jgi:hypothetical protein
MADLRDGFAILVRARESDERETVDRRTEARHATSERVGARTRSRMNRATTGPGPPGRTTARSDGYVGAQRIQARAKRAERPSSRDDQVVGGGFGRRSAPSQSG